MNTDTPNELYGKILGIVAGLPEDITNRSLNVYNTYFFDLVVTLQDKIKDDDFRMPTPSSLVTNHYKIKLSV